MACLVGVLICVALGRLRRAALGEDDIEAAPAAPRVKRFTSKGRGVYEVL